MKTITLPVMVQAELRVASKVKGTRKRLEEINRVMKEAREYYPQCFIDTQGNLPKERTVTTFEKYMNGLTQRKYTIYLE